MALNRLSGPTECRTTKAETRSFRHHNRKKKALPVCGVLYAASSASPQGAELVGHHFLALAGQVTEAATQ